MHYYALLCIALQHRCSADLRLLELRWWWLCSGGWWVPNTVILCNLCSPPGATFNIGPFVQSHAHPSQVTIEHWTSIDQHQTEHQMVLNITY